MNSMIDQLQRFWDERYGGEAYAYGTAPNAFLVQHSPILPAGATALCLADGEGRNGVWLAQQGAEVTSVDISPAGLAKARALAGHAGVALHTLQADVSTAEIGQARWDLIASIFLHLPAGPRRALHRRCAAALKPGGLFLFEAYGPGQLQHRTGGPREAALLPTLADVEADFAARVAVDPTVDPAAGCGLRTLHRFHGLRPVHEGALHHGVGEVVQLVLQRAAD